MDNILIKQEKLEEVLQNYTKKDIIVAFSGGVDSSLLLDIACRQGEANNSKVYAFTIHTMLHPMEELEITENMAKEMGAIHKVIHVDELKEAGIEYNPVNRCYLCKKCMFSKLKEEAERLNVTTIIEGTNLDDTKAYRPGIQALKELGIVSPLLLAEFTKEDIRTLAKLKGIAVSNRPSNPCMATRFPYNTILLEAEMKKVEEMEMFIKTMGFYNVRARVHGELVRLEVDESDLEKLLLHRVKIIAEAKKLGYEYVSLDMEGFRSGSQDAKIISKEVVIH